MGAFDIDELTRRRDTLRLVVKQIEDRRLTAHTKDKVGERDETQESFERAVRELAEIEARLESLLGPDDA